MDLEGLARLGTNPLAIDIAFLNEERFIFQLQAKVRAYPIPI